MAASNRLLSALFLATVAISSASLGGCGRHRGEPLYASTVVVGETVLVRVKHAYVKGDKVVVKTMMVNKTDKPVTIDRDAIGLKLDDGTVISRGSGRSKLYVLAPGEGRAVHVAFPLHGRAASVDQADLVIDGVRVGDDKPRLLGEVALSSRHAIRRNVAALSQSERDDAAEDSEDDAGLEGDAEAAEEPDAQADAEPAAEEAAPEDAAEEWQIGN
jgi:hypothetical protein